MPKAQDMSAYEKSEKERAELLRRLERQKLELFSGASPYNLQQRYQLNINNLVINKFYNSSRLGRPPFSDPQRRAWEDCVWKVLRKQFGRHDRQSVKRIPKDLPSDQHISGVVMGWLLESFELFINYTMDVPAALKEFAREEAVAYGDET